jgi:hypothetical protein
LFFLFFFLRFFLFFVVFFFFSSSPRPSELGGLGNDHRIMPSRHGHTLASGVVENHAWDMNGLEHRALVAKINANLAGLPRDGAADASVDDVDGFNEWLAKQYPAAPKTKQRAFGGMLQPEAEAETEEAAALLRSSKPTGRYLS